MRLAAFVLCSVLLPDLASARVWKVSDPEKDWTAPGARIELKVEKWGISASRESDKVLLHNIAPADVTAIWYDDRAVRNYGREWWDTMGRLCEKLCAPEELSIPVTLMAMGGVGYLAALPFEEHRHFVSIQYRRGDSSDVLTLRTNWFDHFWLMTDLSQTLGRMWLNVPAERARLFWSWADHRQNFTYGSYVGGVPLGDTTYNALLWEDGKGRGVLMLFSVQEHGTPTLTAAEAVTVEKTATRNLGSEYCGGADGNRRLLRLQIGNKLATLASSLTACPSASS